MATIIVPDEAVKVQSKGKWHLAVPMVSEESDWKTACDILWIGGYDDEPVDWPMRAKISDLQAKDICKRCVGRAFLVKD